MIGLRHIPRPRIALRATPVLARRNANGLAACADMAVNPQAAVPEGWLPHALGRLIERRVDSICVHEYGDDIAPGLQGTFQIVSIVALVKWTATNRPTPDKQPIDEQVITAVDRDRKFCLVRHGREFDDSAEEKPPVLLVQPSRCAQINRARAA